MRMSRHWKCQRSCTRIRATAKCSVNWDPTVSTILRQCAHARTKQSGWVSVIRARGGGHDLNPLVLRESGVLVLVNEAFVRRDEASGITVHQGREALDVVGASRQ